MCPYVRTITDSVVPDKYILTHSRSLAPGKFILRNCCVYSMHNYINLVNPIIYLFRLLETMERKKKGMWDTNNLKLAIHNVLNQKMTMREASERFNVPKSTLFDKVKLLKQGTEVEFKPVMGRFKKTFSEEYEQLLEFHVKDLANRCMPLSKKEFLKLAYELANKLKVPHRFNNEKKIAGKHFYDNFMKRHLDLSLRSAESTSLMRAVGFNKTQVDIFFANLQKLMDKYNFRPSNIYNCDETGVTTVQKHEKVMAKKNIRQVGKLTSAERGKNVSIMFCMSAMGQFIPPFFIFPRQRINERLMINAPPESEAVAQPKGWMNNEIFLKWLSHFVKFTRPTKESPILMVLDGHSSHKTLDVINFCRDNHIYLISTPPHTTHKLQPLDRSFMKPFKNAYNERCGIWMRANAGARITEYDIAGIVAEAFKKVARYEIAEAGFRSAGIHPFDKNIFTDLDYLPSDITNIILDSNEPNNEQQATNIIANDTVLTLIEQPEAAQNMLQEGVSVTDSATPYIIQSTSILQSDVTLTSPQEVNTSKSQQPSTSKAAIVNLDKRSSFFLADITNVRKTILDISPLPDAATRRAQVRKRRAQKSEILTDSPYKESLEEKDNEKKKKEEGTCKFKKTNDKGKIRKTKVKPIEKQLKKYYCVVCCEDCDEDWIQCGSCKGWAHEACADIPECSNVYVCDHCKLF